VLIDGWLDWWCVLQNHGGTGDSAELTIKPNIHLVQLARNYRLYW